MTENYPRNVPPEPGVAPETYPAEQPSGTPVTPGPPPSEPFGAEPMAAEPEPMEAQAEEAKSKARQRAEEVKNRVRDTAQSMADQQKNRAAHTVSDLGAALHRAADKLQDENDPRMANYAHSAADHLDAISRKLEERDLASIRGDAEGLARRSPGLFLAGAFLGGLFIGRFLRSSERHISA